MINTHRHTSQWQALQIICTEKWTHFDLKRWVTGGTKIWPGIPSNSRTFESNWLDIDSQFDSNILQLLGIPSRILVPPVT